MANIVELKDKQGNILLPTTIADAVQIGNKTLLDLSYGLSANSYEVEEPGLYFVDVDGNIGAKIDTQGFNATNVSGGSSSGSESTSDLVVIDY